MITFLVESDAFDQEGSFAYAVQELNHQVFQIKYLPFNSTDYSILDKLTEPAIVYCSINMAKDLKRRGLLHKVFLWCDWDVLCCRNYFVHYGPWLIHQNYGFYPFGEMVRLKNFLYETFGKDNKIFVKPDTNDKIFDGEVVASGMFTHWHYSASYYSPEPNSLVLVSKPSEIIEEFRFVVSLGKVVSGTKYRIMGMFCPEMAYGQEEIDFAERAAKDWSPHPIFVMDVAKTTEGLKIIEIGSVNMAGFYKSDLRSIVKSMAKAAEREVNE